MSPFLMWQIWLIIAFVFCVNVSVLTVIEVLRFRKEKKKVEEEKKEKGITWL